MNRIAGATSALFFFLAFSLVSVADESSAKPKAKAAKVAIEVTNDNYRCEKFTLESTANLKLKLLENCNLLLPYSFSISDTLASNGSATYCCVKKNDE